MTVNESAFTPQLEEVINRAIEVRLVDLHTHLPAEVVSYDKATQMATVQPCIMRKYPNGDVVKLPVIQMVPVWHPRVGAAMIHLPIKPGCVGQLHFSERSLDVWLEKGGCVDPADPRKHDLSDAVFYPGSYPLTDSGTVGDEDAIEIRNGSVELRVRADGKVSIFADEILLGDHTLTDFAAVASKVLTEINALRSYVAGLTLPVLGLVAGPPIAPPPVVGSMASSKVKVST